MAKLSCKHEYLAAAMSGRGIDATEFLEVKVAVQDIIRDSMSCANNDTTGNLFTRPPSTWVAPADPKTPSKNNTPGSTNKRNSNDKNDTNGGGSSGVARRSRKKAEQAKRKKK
eukprot:10517967-Ditylum_brightwellii.AAC.1